MRPRTSWSDLPGRRVGVWGLGVEGTAGLRKLRALGVEPAVLVDEARAGSTVEGLPVLAAGSGGLEALGSCDHVVKSPGISRYRDDVRAVERAGAEIVGGVGLWLQEVDRSRVVLVTGTKGKSTTVSIAGHLARGLGTPCFVGGNLGTPPYDPDAEAEARRSGVEHWVIELSSFQATDLASSPPVVAVTALHPDHLDWHGDAETYFADKLSACSQPGADLTVANGDDPLLRARRSSLGPRVAWVGLGAPGERDAAWLDAIGLLGAHNRRNALIARACLAALGVPGAGDEAALERAARGFAPLESRLQVVGRVGSVEFVDDSLSTNVLPTVAALEAFADRPVALLVGGHDRGIDYGGLATHVAARRPPTLIVTLPDNGDRIGRALAAAALPAQARVVAGASVAQAVPVAFEWARGSGGVVLLSPAAPSFGRFTDYRDRARAFAGAVAACSSAAGEAGEESEAAGGPGRPVAEERPVPGGGGHH